MRKVSVVRGAGAIFVGIAAMTAGCSQETVNSAKDDIQRNTAAAQQQIAQVKEKAKPVLDAAKPMTDAAKREAEKKFGQLNIGARVTMALKANTQLPPSIRVDADPDGRGVKLRGVVNSEQQKALAEQIAKDTLGPERRIQNDLSVAY